MAWHSQDAKQPLSGLVRQPVEQGTQVTRHGKNAGVVMPVEELEKLSRERPDFKQHLQSAPPLGGLRIRRDRSPTRKVKL